VAKDRGRPFSRKHRKYWIPVTGGMIVIGAINVGLGMCTYDPPKDPPKRIELDIPKLPPADAGAPTVTDGAVVAPVK
jgi:hypothetical protein